MSNRIKRLNEEEEPVQQTEQNIQTQTQMQTQEQSTIVSDVIAANFVEGYKLASSETGLTVETPIGYQFTIPTDSLDFYKQLFDDGAEHIGSYDRHFETLETALNTEDLKTIVNLYNTVSKSLASVEIKPAMYSIVYILLKSGEISQNELIKLFRAFATENYELDEGSKTKLYTAVKNGIYYYKFLLSLFQYIDE